MKQLLKEKKNIFLLLWPLGIAMYLAARSSTQLAENIFACGIFKGYSAVMSRFSGLLPFSLAEVLVIAVPVLTLVLIVASLAGIIRHAGERLLRTLRLIRNLMLLTGIIFFWFMLGAGTNYYRYEFSHYLGYSVSESTTQELYTLCKHLVACVNEARAAADEEYARKAAQGSVPVVEDDGTLQATEDDETVLAAENDGTVQATEDDEVTGIGMGTYISYMTMDERKAAAVEAMQKLSEKYEVLEGYYPEPKSVILSKYMSEFNITGVYFPWTVEANVNTDIPVYWLGETMCHELSHLRGFMREDEANFIGYLACVNSGEPELVYSGYMEAVINAMNRLYADSPELWRELAAGYSEGVIADMVANSEYWDQYEDTVASEVGEKVNDAYLKANNQIDGTKSYGRMVDLLLAEMRYNGGFDE